MRDRIFFAGLPVIIKAVAHRREALDKILCNDLYFCSIFEQISRVIYCFVCLPTLLKIKLAINATATSPMSHSTKEKTLVNARTVNSSNNATATAPTTRFFLRAATTPEPIDGSILSTPHFTNPSIAYNHCCWRYRVRKGETFLFFVFRLFLKKSSQLETRNKLKSESANEQACGG
jgi:hypothetical protein